MKIKHHSTLGLVAYGKDRQRFQIMLTVTFNGGRLRQATGVVLDKPFHWDGDAGCVVPGPGMTAVRAAALNAELARLKDAAESVFRYYEAVEEMPTPARAKERYLLKTRGPALSKPSVSEPAAVKSAAVRRRRSGAEESGTKAPGPSSPLTEVFAAFEAECGVKNSWTKATCAKFVSLLRDLETYRPGMKCSDLDESVLTCFVDYLRNVKVLNTPRKRRGGEDDRIGLRNSSIVKKLSYLRWVLNWATSKGINSQMAYKSFKPTLRTTQNRVIYLTAEELRRVIGLDISGLFPGMEVVRDIFLFCCFSGLRYSDAQNLRWADVGDGYIDVTTVKTADSIRIETNDMTRLLLDKYREKALPDGFVLPRFTNQAMNRDLKELCRLAGIDERIRVTEYRGSERLDEVKEKWELVGTHTGRKTFIVQALSRGISPNIVMKWTGHSDYAAMKPYIDIVDAIKAREMDKMNFLG